MVATILPTGGAHAIIGGGAVAEGSSQQLAVASIESDSGFCTGVFIAVDMLLTAAHCIRSRAEDLKVTIGADRNSQVRLDAIGVRVHERHDRDNRNDLALIRIVPRFDVPYVFAAIADTAAPGPGQAVTAVGYGRIERDDPGNDVLHSKQLVIAGESDDERDFIVDQRGGGICEGDSGGPAFVSGKHGIAVIGIASYVFSPAGIDDICRGSAAYVDLRYYKGWVEKAKAELR